MLQAIFALNKAYLDCLTQIKGNECNCSWTLITQAPRREETFLINIVARSLHEKVKFNELECKQIDGGQTHRLMGDKPTPDGQTGK